MKNIKKLITLILLFAVTIGFTSCLDDDDTYSVIIGTYRVLDDDHFYFEIEQKDKIVTMYPGDTRNFLYRDLPDGQRVFIYYDLLDEKESGYDYNAKIYGIDKILTKDIIPITEATEDSIGNDPIDIVSSRISLDKEFIHMQFQFYVNSYSNITHMLNMVIPETEEDLQDEFINLEFRHNAYDDYNSKIVPGLVTFRLKNIEDLMEDKKGVRIKYKSINSGNKEVELLFDEEVPAKPERQIGVKSIK